MKRRQSLSAVGNRAPWGCKKSMSFAPSPTSADVIADIAPDEVSAFQGLPARSTRGGAPFAGATPSSGPGRQLPAIVQYAWGNGETTPQRASRRHLSTTYRRRRAASRRQLRGGEGGSARFRGGSALRGEPRVLESGGNRRVQGDKGKSISASIRVRRISPRLERVLDIDVVEYPRRYVVL